MDRIVYSGMKANVRINFPWLAKISEKSIKTSAAMYEKIPLIFRAMNIRGDNLVRVPFYFYRGEEEVEQYPFEESLPFNDLLKWTEMALMAAGKSSVLVLEKQIGDFNILGAGLQWLNPFTVRVKMLEMQDGTHQRVFDQFVSGQHYPLKKQYWSEEEMYYAREFSFSDEVDAGTVPALVAMADANASYYLSNFLSKFFEGGAVPPMIVSVKEGTGKLPKKEITNWFREKLKNFMERILVLEEGNVQVDQLASELKSFEINAVDEHVVVGVANAFGMSPTSLMAGSANRATAEFEDKHLMRTIESRARFHESNLNRFLGRFGYSVKAKIQELPEFQEDEEQRSTALYNLVQAGTPLDRAYEILGYDLSEDYRLEIEQSRKQRLLTVQQPVIEPAQLPPPNGEVKMELRRWMRKALQRFKEGKSNGFVFESDFIPEEEQRRIYLGLSNVKSVEEIKNIFRESQYA